MYQYIYRNRFDQEEYIALYGKNLVTALAAYAEDPDAIPIEAYELVDVLVEEENAWDES